MSFTTRNLAGNRVLVQGTDIDGNTGKTVIDGSEWAELRARKTHQELHGVFDEKVREFFAPLVDAVDAIAEQHAPQVDPTYTLVLTEGVEASEGVAEEVVVLSKDSVILRLLEEDSASPRLIWITDTELEILEAAAIPALSPEKLDAIRDLLDEAETIAAE